MTPLVPRNVNDVSYVKRINYDHFFRGRDNIQ